MKLLSRLAVPILSLWLFAWIALSWDAIQDDALIHLRYADYLHRVHFITYDGIHASYGTSSLLFVGLLAVLRGITTSPLLSRFVSTFFHLVLFATFAAFYLRTARRASPRIQAFSLAILLLLALPSAVRWLDDGMETGLVLCLVTLVLWRTHRLSLQPTITSADFLLCAALGFTLVILRNELAIVAFFASAILALATAGTFDPAWPKRLLRAIPQSSHFLLGAIAAALAIRLVMHSFLPDTALAKSHGIHHFFPSLVAAIEVIVGALLFGVGTLGLWFLSAAITLAECRTRLARLLPTLAANLIFPVVLLASCARGQEIQGVRYLIWTFWFSILWNLLELRHRDTLATAALASTPLAFAAFAAACLLALPVESRLMFRVLTTRARTMKLFMAQNLAAALPGKLGLAIDVGYISYYTQDSICDAAGLVNGRAMAALPGPERIAVCAARQPAFAFLNADQTHTISRYVDFSTWRVCGQYDFANMHVPDRHFLLVRPELAQTACAATGYPSAPASIAFTDTAY